MTTDKGKDKDVKACKVAPEAIRAALERYPREVLVDLIAYKYGEYGDPASDDPLGLADALDDDLPVVARKHGILENDPLPLVVERLLGE